MMWLASQQGMVGHLNAKSTAYGDLSHVFTSGKEVETGDIRRHHLHMCLQKHTDTGHCMPLSCFSAKCLHLSLITLVEAARCAYSFFNRPASGLLQFYPWSVGVERSPAS